MGRSRRFSEISELIDTCFGNDARNIAAVQIMKRNLSVRQMQSALNMFNELARNLSQVERVSNPEYFAHLLTEDVRRKIKERDWPIDGKTFFDSVICSLYKRFVNKKLWRQRKCRN